MIIIRIIMWRSCDIFFSQNVPPDLSVCGFILANCLSVRALQEMLTHSEHFTAEVKHSFFVVITYLHLSYLNCTVFASCHHLNKNSQNKYKFLALFVNQRWRESVVHCCIKYMRLVESQLWLGIPLDVRACALERLAACCLLCFVNRCVFRAVGVAAPASSWSRRTVSFLLSLKNHCINLWCDIALYTHQTSKYLIAIFEGKECWLGS